MHKTKVRFAPWLGAEYEHGYRGKRILLVCESHYGSRQYERPTVTPEIIKALAFGERHPRATGALKMHPHYAKIMVSVLNEEAAWRVPVAKRREFWRGVAYYNYLQEFIADKRVTPPNDAWERSKDAFSEVLDALEPQLIVCFSRRNGGRVKSLAGDIPVQVVNHPSSRFCYSKVKPLIAAHFDQVVQQSGQEQAFEPGEAFRRWQEASERALPARGPFIPEPEKGLVFAGWKHAMEEIDRNVAEDFAS